MTVTSLVAVVEPRTDKINKKWFLKEEKLCYKNGIQHVALLCI